MKFLPNFKLDWYAICVGINICVFQISIIGGFYYYWPDFAVCLIIDYWLISNIGDNSIPYPLKPAQ